MNAHSTEQPLERRELGTDEDVVRRVLAGEVHLYEVIMRRHNRRLYRVARSILREDDEASDVMQDAYVRAYEHLAQFKGAGTFSTWLTRIAVYEAFARLRRRGRHASFDEEEAEHEDCVMATNPRTPEQSAHDAELRAFLERAIDRLPSDFRTVFMMRAMEEMSTADVAQVLDIPEETVKTRLHRARGLLRRVLTQRLEMSSKDAFSFAGARCDHVVRQVLRRIGRS
ncbi:RNA polymerase sigma factor [Pendulispora albinea]|uniref:RNA polymerase sigma factor n=1 Tax=Pendulispora albinea TaxID=2741071 RepID=A0ABZ2M7Q3_9BACT